MSLSSCAAPALPSSARISTTTFPTCAALRTSGWRRRFTLVQRGLATRLGSMPTVTGDEVVDIQHVRAERLNPCFLFDWPLGSAEESSPLSFSLHLSYTVCLECTDVSFWEWASCSTRSLALSPLLSHTEEEMREQEEEKVNKLACIFLPSDCLTSPDNQHRAHFFHPPASYFSFSGTGKKKTSCFTLFGSLQPLPHPPLPPPGISPLQSKRSSCSFPV